VLRLRWILLALLLPVIAGCSASAPKAPKPTPTPSTAAPAGQAQPRYLQQDDLDRFSRDTPERALMELWFAVQYRDMLGAYALVTGEIKREAPTLRRFSTFVMADYPRWLNAPKILFSRRHGAFRVLTVEYQTPGNPQPQRFAMTFVREAGTWKLAYDFYLANRLQGQ
jgi:hypothetical protein